MQGRCKLRAGKGRRWLPSVSPDPALRSAVARRRRGDRARFPGGCSPPGDDAGGRGVAAGGPEGPQPEPAARPGRGGRGGGSSLHQPAGSRGLGGRGPSHPHGRLPALPPGPAPGPSRCRTEPACGAPARDRGHAAGIGTSASPEQPPRLPARSLPPSARVPPPGPPSSGPAPPAPPSLPAVRSRRPPGLPLAFGAGSSRPSGRRPVMSGWRSGSTSGSRPPRTRASSR